MLGIPNNSNNNDRDKKRETTPNVGGQSSDGSAHQSPQQDTSGGSLGSSQLPDLGALVGEGTYVISAENSEGERKILSAGDAAVHEKGMVGQEQLDRTMLEMLQVKTVDDARRALCGDSGHASSSTRVGYTKAYEAGWNRLWGKDPSAN